MNSVNAFNPRLMTAGVLLSGGSGIIELTGEDDDIDNAKSIGKSKRSSASFGDIDDGTWE